MTRFARAKGSKASNERTPEDPTPWSEMKKQLLEKNREAETSQERQAIYDEKRARYKEFLMERELEKDANTKWADFPEVSNGIHKSKNKNLKNKNKVGMPQNVNKNEIQNMTIKKGKNKINNLEEASKNNETTGDTVENSVSTKVKKIKKKKAITVNVHGQQSNLVVQNKISKKNTSEEIKSSVDNELTQSQSKVKKIKKKNIKNKPEDILSSPNNEQSVSNTSTSVVKKAKKRKSNDAEESNIKKPRTDSKTSDATSGKPVNKKKIKNKNKVPKDNLTEQDLKRIEKKKQKRIKQIEKKKQFKKDRQETENNQDSQSAGENSVQNVSSQPPDSFNSSENGQFKPRRDFSNDNRPFKQRKQFSNEGNKKRKVRDKEEHPRKKPLVPHKMFINGKEIEVAYVEGFPVKKEDAERLKKLRKEMISKGIPRSQIDSALKLERRRAEKAFAREKKKVCFNCRKSGHNLSECPELNKNELAETAGSGICFKCGSTEHTHFECKVVRGQEFKFAKCFICQEQGHIARQCPDNARGLYPKGGACNVCGDVTHLKKDCPQYQAQQQREENNLSVGTMNNNNPDYMEEDNTSKISIVKKPNKVIKFT